MTPNLVHRRQNGFFSSHLTLRILFLSVRLDPSMCTSAVGEANASRRGYLLAGFTPVPRLRLACSRLPLLYRWCQVARWAIDIQQHFRVRVPKRRVSHDRCLHVVQWMENTRANEGQWDEADKGTRDVDTWV